MEADVLRDAYMRPAERASKSIDAEAEGIYLG